MGTVIQVENLSKSYLIGHQSREPYLALRDVMVETMKNAGRRILHPMRAGSRGNSVEEIWALKDVSFEVKQGDRLGIIGRNGAGKSTLLKILSRITEPTRGRVRIKGRVGSLLEVGTGFHPELTGRENIFLNGAILGMTRMEIRRKFDEIVDFAEIEKFLDTPVKRYSSGMYVRLAFAVAANMEPENLVVDEVLAVGDHRFQQKCLDKMEHFGKEGRTILFVSHNMTAIEQLCRSCMLIETGQIKRIDSDIRSIIRIYLFGLKEKADTCRWNNPGPVYDNPWFIPNTFSIVNRDGEIMSMPVRNDEEVWVQIEGEVRQLDPALTIGYAVFTKDGTQLYWSYHTDQEPAKWPKLGIGPIKLRSRIPTRFLNEGSYRIELIGGLHFRQWLFEPGVNAPAIFLSIQGGLSDSPYWMVQRPGLIAPLLEWSLVV